MKKFVHVMFCALLMFVFIALNYLLWDRENKVKSIENLESLNASKNASIDVLGREITKLEDEKKLLQEKVSELERENQRLNTELEKLRKEVAEAEEKLAHKLAVINKLMQTADLNQAEEPIRKWVEAVNKGNYETAYRLLQTQMTNQGVLPTIADFADGYKRTVKGIKIKSIELYTGEVKSNTGGDAIFKVALDIGMAENNPVGGIRFNDGLNEIYVTVDYNKEKDQWIITGIYFSI